jgi:hypothetical protein
MTLVQPRKTLPINTPTVEDYMRWFRSVEHFNPIELTPEDKAWKVDWEKHTDYVFHQNKLPNPTTCASWIEPDLTFTLRVSLLDQ